MAEKTMMPTPAEIEKVARAMCLAQGVDPDEIIQTTVSRTPSYNDQGHMHMVYRPPMEVAVTRWSQNYARAFDAIVAHRAIEAVFGGKRDG